MTEPKQSRVWGLDSIANSRTTPEQSRRAALAVAAAYPDDPLIARHLLDVLGLLDLPRVRPERLGGPAPVDAIEPAPSLVDTEAAVEALGIPAPTLFRFADARIVAPARVDPDGARWWNLCDLRNRLSADLDGHGEEKD